MNKAIEQMLRRYNCQTALDYENALKEILQELALLGLWRARFFEHASFYGGTALRIFSGLDRFSEDLDFSLNRPQPEFTLARYHEAMQTEIASYGFEVDVTEKQRAADSAIQSAFIKANTRVHLLKIGLGDALASTIHSGKLLKVRFELDTDPPPDFQIDAKTLLQPIPFRVICFSEPDLCAGKWHALLWRNRVKGRDWYDVLWLIGRNVPVRLAHLKARLIQTGHWQPEQQFGRSDLLALFSKRLEAIDIAQAAAEVRPYLSDPRATDLWSAQFFWEIISQRLRAV